MTVLTYNHREILRIFLTGGAYAPYAPCVSTPLTLRVMLCDYATTEAKIQITCSTNPIFYFSLYFLWLWWDCSSNWRLLLCRKGQRNRRL